jgi:hypothetical protein
MSGAVIAIRKSAKCSESVVTFSSLKGKYTVKHTGNIIYKKINMKEINEESDLSNINDHLEAKHDNNKTRSNKKFHTDKNLKRIIGVNLNNSFKAEESRNDNIKLILNNNKPNDNSKINDNSSNITDINLKPAGVNNLSILNVYKLCSICDLYIEKGTVFTCQHIVCDKCCKVFYEDRIELGYINLQCPIYSCKFKIDISSIKERISEAHYKRIESESTAFLNNSPLCKSNLFQKHINLFKNYLKKNVLDISDNDESYYLFNKFKDEFCGKCREPALFGKFSGNSLKCLNCYSLFCKFCFKPVSNDLDHFDRSGTKYCKIYFRTKYDLETASKIKKALIALLIIVISYALFTVGLYLRFVNGVKALCSSKLLFPVRLLAYLILLCLWGMFAILLLPFYPLVLLVLES